MCHAAATVYSFAAAACMDQVAVRVDALGSELDQIKSSFDGKSKGRHDSIKIQAR